MFTVEVKILLCSIALRIIPWAQNGSNISGKIVSTTKFILFTAKAQRTQRFNDFKKSTLLFLAVLPVRSYFGRINGKEEVKTSLRPSRRCKQFVRMICSVLYANPSGRSTCIRLCTKSISRTTDSRAGINTSFSCFLTT